MRKAAPCNGIGGSLALLVGACLSGGVQAQDDRPPLYQVEMIIFAHDELDPAEEVFEPVLTAADRAVAPPGSAVPQRREPFRYEEPDLEALLTGREPIGSGAASDADTGALDTRGQTAPADNDDIGGAPTEAIGQNGVLDEDQAPILELDILPLQDLGPFGIRRLSADELQLGSERATLERLSAYRPLLHVGWVQEGLPESEAVPFDLSQLGRFTPTGTVQLHISQFQRLRLRLDLEYRPLDAAYPPTELVSRFELRNVAAPPRFVLREDRVARAGELHYFDHPAFGVLAIVRPQARAPADDAAVPTPAP